MRLDSVVTPKASSPLKFAILGPVIVERAGLPVDTGPVKQRGVLVTLLLNANRPTTVASIIEGVWGDDPPQTAAKMVQVFVSRLRSVLHDAPPKRIITSGPSYQIEVHEDELDLLRSRSLQASAVAVLATDPRRALMELDRALALWGSPLVDVADLPVATSASMSLREEHLNLRDLQIEAMMGCGRFADAIRELRTEIELDPYRDRARANLMVALYRSGRQVAALEAFADYRTELAATTGLDPSATILLLHERILRQDADLNDFPSPPAYPQGATSISEPTLPRVPRRAIGVVIVALACAAGLALILSVALPSRPMSPGISANSLVEIDQDTGALVDDIPVGTSPGPVTVASQSVWAASGDDHTLTQVDLATNKVVNTYGLGAAPTALTASQGIVWISDGFDGKLSRVLVSAHQVSEPFYPARQISGLVATATFGDDLWVGLSDHSLVELNQRNLEAVSGYTLPFQPRAITVDGSLVWAIGMMNGLLARVDTVTGKVDSIHIDARPFALGSGFGSIWVAASHPDELIRLTEAGREVARYKLTASPSGVTTTTDSVWVAEAKSGTIERIDPAGKRLQTTVTIGHPIGGIAASGDRLWLTTH